MANVMGFGDIGCLNESAAGSLGAGMASFVRAGFPVARGFVVAPSAFSDFLKKGDVASALDLFRSGAEAPDESWRTVKSVFSRTRLDWNHEMEILTAYGELDSLISASPSTIFGAGQAPVYAAGGQDLLDAIKHCWLRWLRSEIGRMDRGMPAVIVREVLDSEVSVELRRKGQELRARVVFGLPEGLHDSTVSADIFDFKPDGTLDRMEMRPQSFQHIMKEQGPARVPVSGDFSGDEKISGDMLASLNDVMAFMREHPGITQCTVCFVSSRPVVCSATLMSDPVSETAMPPRERSMSLLQPSLPARVPAVQGPVVATKVYFIAENPAQIISAGESYADGIMVPGNPLASKDWGTVLAQLISESKRLLRSGTVVMELGDTAPATLESLSKSLKAISEVGMRPGVLIPGIRSQDELEKVISALKSSAAAPGPEIWARVMYPSNLFFIGAMAKSADVLALDLDSLARLMLGGGEGGEWMLHAMPALETALEGAFSNKPAAFAILSEDMVAMPSMLEFLVRRGADIICVRPSEIHTVKHIIASVEKRMLLEQGRA